ncbi:MAG: hypothetical protein K9M03_03415 [Kiritimatiellales bacterium]|nr:hypothetical protein [Kiritimatiellales bacterium]
MPRKESPTLASLEAFVYGLEAVQNTVANGAQTHVIGLVRQDLLVILSLSNGTTAERVIKILKRIESIESLTIRNL